MDTPYWTNNKFQIIGKQLAVLMLTKCGSFLIIAQNWEMIVIFLVVIIKLDIQEKFLWPCRKPMRKDKSINNCFFLSTQLAR